MPEIENGCAETPTDGIVRHGQQLNITCDEKYEVDIRIAEELPRCLNGSFTYTPKCNPKKCQKYSLTSTRSFSGILLAPSLEHGAVARFVCHRGHTLTYSAEMRNEYKQSDPFDGTIRCSYGEWIGPTPSCRPVECPPPGPFANGTIKKIGSPIIS